MQKESCRILNWNEQYLKAINAPINVDNDMFNVIIPASNNFYTAITKICSIISMQIFLPDITILKHISPKGHELIQFPLVFPVSTDILVTLLSSWEMRVQYCSNTAIRSK